MPGAESADRAVPGTHRVYLRRLRNARRVAHLRFVTGASAAAAVASNWEHLLKYRADLFWLLFFPVTCTLLEYKSFVKLQTSTPPCFRVRVLIM